MEITIRYAQADDVPTIHMLTQAAYAEYRALIPYSSIWQETPERITEELAQGPILLAVLEDGPVGSVRCHMEQVGAERFVYLHRLAILPAYRRRGIGRLLVEAVEAIAREQGIRQIRLEVRAAQPENIAFYRTLGYLLGSVTQYLPDGSPRSYLMTKDLTEG